MSPKRGENPPKAGKAGEGNPEFAQKQGKLTQKPEIALCILSCATVLIQQSGCQHLILRTSWVYGARGGNFAKTMVRLARERQHLTVINDQFGAPTGADLLADVTAHAIRHLQARPQDGGLYHCVAGGETTWFDYAQYVLSHIRQHKPALELKVKDVAPVATSAFPTPAQRPHNSRLNTTRLQATFGLTLPHWQQGVERMLDEAF